MIILRKKWLFMEVIGPSSDLRNHHSEISKLHRTLAEAEEDARAGRVAPMQDAFDDIRKSLVETEAE